MPAFSVNRSRITLSLQSSSKKNSSEPTTSAFSRVRQRLRENAEVVGSDEFFFEDDCNDNVIRDLFTEKAGILDGDADTEVDLGSYAYQIWKNAIDRDPALQK